MYRRLLVLSLAATLPCVASALRAGSAEARPPGPPPHARFERDIEKLGLDPAQEEKVLAILDASKQARQERRTQLRAAFDQMHALLEQEPPDEAAIMRQAESIGQLKTEGHKAMLHTLLQVRAELTPEQRTQLKAMRQHDGPPPWHGRRGGPDD